MESNSQKIKISLISQQRPDFASSDFPKDKTIAYWLIYWIENALKNEEIKIGDMIPSKAELASFFNVSIGTVQNAIRLVEDKGYFASKQCVGTLIKDPKTKNDETEKLTSKRENVIIQIKKLIIEKKYQINKPLPSARQISQIIKSSNNTTRLALEFLVEQGIIKKQMFRSSDSNWILQEIPNLNEKEKNTDSIVKAQTLTQKLEEKLKVYISKNFKTGEKIAAHKDLASLFNVSIRTIHDALKGLSKSGILLSRRGQYGTIVLKDPLNKTFESKPENSIFAPAKLAQGYHYKKVEDHIKTLIKKDYEIGDKLPSMEELSSRFMLSANTIRKAIFNLTKEGILRCERGKYGGTYIIEMPSINQASFTWLALNPNYVKK